MSDSQDTERLFAKWLAQREDGETIPIDAFSAEYPSHAEELRRMHEDWRRMMKAQRGSTRDTSLGDRLRERFGSGVDPEVSLDGDATKAMDRPESESRLYEELHARGPSSGRYRLDGELAQGGMGAILRVYDKDLRRNLAMKVMLEEKQGRLSRFLEEAQVTGQLDHPGIVPVHELGIDARGKVFFTMKLVKGRDLREVFDMVKAGVDGWNMTRALSVLQRVCEAMAFAHEKKVIHRDLKPGNVMVGRHGEVYVMDWGLARVLGQKDTKDVRVAPVSQSVVNTERRESSKRQLGVEANPGTPDAPLLTMDGDAIGTPSYMPLEQAEGNLDAIGPRSDVYAVGAMLYHLLAGHPPYQAADETVGGRVILKRVLSAPPESIRTIAKTAPAELIAICEKAMARKPAQRYATMAELGDDLRAYLERRVVKAYRTGVLAETTMWVARNRALATAIAVVILGLIAFGGWQADRNRVLAAERERVFRLSDVKELRDLQARGKALLDDRAAVYRSYSGYGEVTAERRQWIEDVETLATRLPSHEATLTTIEARGRKSAEGGSFEFDSKEDSWWHLAVTELVDGFRALTLDDPRVLSVRAMRDRIAEFESIYARSVVDHRAQWDICIASIADASQCPQYKGLQIVPQVGLVPIGRDPQSTMWEFWFVDATGLKPERGENGELMLTGDFGLVFVLLPGGKFWMGAQSEDPSGRNFDPDASSVESPVHEVSLAPFFFSKYEMTEHQWILASRDGSWAYGSRNSRLPADSVSWHDATNVLPTLHLALPTESQWEYACRAGTSTSWSTGTEKASLLGFANLGDYDLKDGVDGFSVVGSLRPDAFGLHDTHGNVWEWCVDSYEGEGDYAKSIDALTGERPCDRTHSRVYRGGACWNGAGYARSAYRLGDDPGNRDDDDGLRPRRDVMPH